MQICTLKNMILLLPLVLAAGLLAAGCSDTESLLDGSDKPCGIDPGLYANITGTADPVIMCVPDDRIEGTIDTGVHVDYSPQSGRYLISAVYTEENTTHEIDLSFTAQRDVPAVLIATANEAQAQLDSSFVWVFYQVTEQGGPTYTTTSASGSITVSFNDPGILVATFGNIELRLTDDPGNPSSIVRAITEGYLNLSTDSS